MYDLRKSGKKLAEAKQSPEAANILKSLFQVRIRLYIRMERCLE